MNRILTVSVILFLSGCSSQPDSDAEIDSEPVSFEKIEWSQPSMRTVTVCEYADRADRIGIYEVDLLMSITEPKPGKPSVVETRTTATLVPDDIIVGSDEEIELGFLGGVRPDGSIVESHHPMEIGSKRLIFATATPDSGYRAEAGAVFVNTPDGKWDNGVIQHDFSTDEIVALVESSRCEELHP